METTTHPSAQANAANASASASPSADNTGSNPAANASSPTPVASPDSNASPTPGASSPHKPTLVLGASDNPARYSFLAVNKLRSKQHPVTAIGRKNARIADVEIVTGQPPLQGIDTVTIYLNPQNQKEYYPYLLSLHPKRIIFNPGAENPELATLAKTNGIQPVEACTLVLLSTGQF